MNGKSFNITGKDFKKYKTIVSLRDFDIYMKSRMKSKKIRVITFCVSLRFTKAFADKIRKENKEIFNMWQEYEVAYDEKDGYTEDSLRFRSNKELIEMIVKFGYSRALKKPCPNSFQAIPEHLLPFVKVMRDPNGYSDYTVLRSDDPCDSVLYNMMKNQSFEYYSS
jgi:hypothetical protein